MHSKKLAFCERTNAKHNNIIYLNLNWRFKRETWFYYYDRFFSSCLFVHSNIFMSVWLSICLRRPRWMCSVHTRQNPTTKFGSLILIHFDVDAFVCHHWCGVLISVVCLTWSVPFLPVFIITVARWKPNTFFACRRLEEEKEKKHYCVIENGRTGRRNTFSFLFFRRTFFFSTLIISQYVDVCVDNEPNENGNGVTKFERSTENSACRRSSPPQLKWNMFLT